MSGYSLGVYCPSGGDFYICQHGVMQQFLGCCTSNPCLRSAGSCPLADLRPLSFNATAYDQIKPQTCFDGISADWYACSQTSPPFLGCCSSNACGEATGCPQQDLNPASLLNTEDSGLFAATETSTPAAASSTLGTSIATSSTTGPPSTSNQHSHTVLPPRAWAWISAACVAFVALLGALLYLAGRKMRNTRLVPAISRQSPVARQGEPSMQPSIPGHQELEGTHHDTISTQSPSAGSDDLNIPVGPQQLSIYEAHRSQAQNSCPGSSNMSTISCRYKPYRASRTASPFTTSSEQSTAVSGSTDVQLAEPLYELE